MLFILAVEPFLAPLSYLHKFLTDSEIVVCVLILQFFLEKRLPCRTLRYLKIIIFKDVLPGHLCE